MNAESTLRMQNSEMRAQVRSLIDDLDHEDGLHREQARQALIRIGRPAVVGLIRALQRPSHRIRWEAAKALGEIGDPHAADALVDALDDEDVGVRWVAADALVNLGGNALEPMLKAVISHSDDIWLREGAHRVLKVLAQRGYQPIVMPVLRALEDIEPAIEAPFAAYEALLKYRANH